MNQTRSVYAALAAIAIACLADPSLPSCTGGACSAGRSAHGDALAGAALALVAATAVLVALGRRCTAVLLLRARLRTLRESADPEVAGLAAQLHLTRVSVLASDERFAFCSGMVRPRIVVSSSLVGALARDELVAVLLHEHSHQRRRHPLRRALRGSLAEAFFFLPLARWWARRSAILDEVAADQDALAVCGRGALARALLAATPEPFAAPAAFAGDAAVRVRSLSGEPLGLPDAPAAMWRATLLGAAVVIISVACAMAALSGR